MNRVAKLLYQVLIWELEDSYYRARIVYPKDPHRPGMQIDLTLLQCDHGELEAGSGRRIYNLTICMLRMHGRAARTCLP